MCLPRTVCPRNSGIRFCAKPFQYEPGRPASNCRLLQHIIEAIDNIQEYTAGMELAAYMTDRKTRDAVIRNLEVIGEACNNIAKHHPEFAAKHSAIPWGFAYEMRNALSHGYFTVDHTIVWQTIKQDLPKLRTQVTGLI